MIFEKHSDGNALAQWLANHVAKLLADSISKKGRASIAVSGGSTPKQFFIELSQQEIDWKSVSITLVDERWVEGSSDRSNAKLVADLLLQNAAVNAVFLPLFRNDIKVSEIGNVEYEYRALLPFDVVILGMGGDGHTASFFPGGTKLNEATDLGSDTLLIDMNADGADEQRVTFTLAPLVNAGETILHIEGEGKKHVLDDALNEGEANALPIRHVLNACPKLRVVWAP